MELGGDIKRLYSQVALTNLGSTTDVNSVTNPAESASFLDVPRKPFRYTLWSCTSSAFTSDLAASIVVSSTIFPLLLEFMPTINEKLSKVVIPTWWLPSTVVARMQSPNIKLS